MGGALKSIPHHVGPGFALFCFSDTPGARQPCFGLQSTGKCTGSQAFLSVFGFIISLSRRSRLAVT